ncbi:MAG TPA: hypothetical protein VIP77_18330 [Jiangellaceae bacterium]
MPDTADALQYVISGVIVLFGVGACVAWIPATRHDPGGLPARVFLTVGLVTTVFDVGGLGMVLGLALVAMGLMVWWESQPEPEVPRPHLLGLLVAAGFTGLAVLATVLGWGPLGRVPEQVRMVAALVIGGAGALGTLAVADRARVRLRDALRRRFHPEDEFENQRA